MPASAVSMTVRWCVPLGESRSLTEALHWVMMGARSSPGCLRCSVSTHVSEKVGVEYVEEWATEDLLRREVRTDRFRSLATIMEHATTRPVVEFVLPGGARGLEYADEVLSATDR
jgi:hypothetical protein